MKRLLKQNKLDETFLKIASTFAELSHCVSHQVGAVLVKDGRIISTGYNGSPPGYINCDEKFDKNNFEREAHHEWSNIYEPHAEGNAIGFAAKNGISTEGSTIYCTLQPCLNCTKMIITAGIKRIVYDKSYDKNPYQKEQLELLMKCGIEFVQKSRTSA